MADISGPGGIARKVENGGAGFDTIGGGGDDGNGIGTVREDEVVAERAVWVKFHGLSVNCNFCLRVGPSVEDDLGVDVHEKLTLGKAERAEIFRSSPAACFRMAPAGHRGL